MIVIKRHETCAVTMLLWSSLLVWIS